MSKQLGQSVIAGFNLKPALVSLAHADMLAATIQSLSDANAREENEASKTYNVTLGNSYGYSTYGNEKVFAFADGIAFIPISGTLINRLNWCWMGWITGYNFIRDQLNAALDDEDVKLIVFDVNSGGGMVAGCFELAEDIYKSRAVKPSVAVVDASCYSAAYALSSSATKVISTPSGGIGSIGALAMHIDISKALDDIGVKVNLIYSGDHKVDGNPYQKLPTSVKADIQKSVDESRQEFVALVARNRGLDAKAIYDTEAQSYSAKEALQLGLIDAIAAPIEAVAAFNELSGSEPDDEENTMSKQQEVAPGAESTAATAEQQETVQTVAEKPQVDGKAAERQRIQGILNCEEAKDRSKLANHLALSTDLSVEDARKVLAASATEQTETTANAFTQAMDTGKNPDVGAGGDTEASEDSAAKRILKAQALVTNAQVH